MVTLYLLGAVACLFDYRCRRIPNAIIVLMFAWGMFYHSLKTGLGGAGFYVLRAVCCILFLFLFFLLRGLGAGDVKLLAVMSGFLPGGELLFFLFLSFLFALFFALVPFCRGAGTENRLHKLWLGQCTGTGSVCLTGPILLSFLVIQLKGGI